MQPHSSPPPPFGRPSAADGNEFVDAVARLVESRERVVAGPAVLPRTDTDDAQPERWRLLSVLLGGAAFRRALARALAVVPLAVAGFAAVWFLRSELPPAQGLAAVTRAEPPSSVPPAPATTPPVRAEVIEAAAAPPPAPTPPPAAAAVEIRPAPPPPVDTRPLTREEIRELQGKLSAAGFAAGPVDGVVGPQTQAALRRYTEARNIARPEPSREVLSRLRAEPPVQP